MFVSVIRMERVNGMKRTKVNGVVLQVRELIVVDYDRGNVASVVVAVDPGGDVGSPVNDTELATVGVAPVDFDFIK